MKKQRLVIGITGTSGAAYGLAALREPRKVTWPPRAPFLLRMRHWFFGIHRLLAKGLTPETVVRWTNSNYRQPSLRGFRSVGARGESFAIGDPRICVLFESITPSPFGNVANRTAIPQDQGQPSTRCCPASTAFRLSSAGLSVLTPDIPPRGGPVITPGMG